MRGPLTEHFAVRCSNGWLTWHGFTIAVGEEPELYAELAEASSTADTAVALFSGLGLEALALSVAVVRRSVTTTCGEWERQTVEATR